MSTLQELFERVDDITSEELDLVIAELRKMRQGFNAAGNPASLKASAKTQPSLLEPGKITL